MAEFASKGLANGVGIPALVLGSLGFLGSANNGNGGILGGLFGGGNCNQVSALMAENANLRAEKYSDNKNAEVYVASRAENKALRDELMGFIRPLSNEAAQNRERIAVLASPCSKPTWPRTPRSPTCARSWCAPNLAPRLTLSRRRAAVVLPSSTTLSPVSTTR